MSKVDKERDRQLHFTMFDFAKGSRLQIAFKDYPHEKVQEFFMCAEAIVHEVNKRQRGVSAGDIRYSLRSTLKILDKAKEKAEMLAANKIQEKPKIDLIGISQLTLRDLPFSPLNLAVVKEPNIQPSISHEVEILAKAHKANKALSELIAAVKVFKESTKAPHGRPPADKDGVCLYLGYNFLRLFDTMPTIYKEGPFFVALSEVLSQLGLPSEDVSRLLRRAIPEIKKVAEEIPPHLYEYYLKYKQAEIMVAKKYAQKTLKNR